MVLRGGFYLRLGRSGPKPKDVDLYPASMGAAEVGSMSGETLYPQGSRPDATVPGRMTSSAPR